jgi:hypothetical protein
MKTYCTCSKNDYICRGLHDEPLTYLYDVLWVHAGCCLPFFPVWTRYLRRCESCLKMTCLPWETYCQKCFRYEFQKTRPYKGLLRASKRAGAALPWPLPRTAGVHRGGLVELQGDSSPSNLRMTPTNLSLEI